jgi:hypothetical protein
MRNAQPNITIFTLAAIQVKQFVLNKIINREDLPEGAVLAWKVRAYDIDGDTVPFSDNSSFFYTGYSLAGEKVVTCEQNKCRITPNPFNPETRITLSNDKIFSEGFVRISDISGRIVKTFAITKNSRSLTFDWDGRNDENKMCPTGLYVCSIVSGNYRESVKIMLAR